MPSTSNLGGGHQVTTTDGNLVTQIRQAIDAAHQAGRPTPGRPTLVRLTGATDHAVRKVLADLASSKADAGESAAIEVRQADSLDEGEPQLQTVPNTSLATAGATNGSVGEVVPPATNSVTSANSQPIQRPAPGGRLVAWTGFVFGSVMSIAANVLHAWLPAVHQAPGWSPGLAPQIGAAVWPIGLMLAVEALSRVHWPKGLGWGLARYGGAGAVALGSAVISYGHLRDLLIAWQYAPVAASVGPLVLDGLMLVSGFALLAQSMTKATTN
jgi:hypothetical protein